MNKLTLSILIVCIALGVNLSPVNGQSKKKLRAEIETLTGLNGQLQQQNRSLAVENQRLTQKTQLLETAVNRLKQDSAAISMDYQLLQEDYQELQASAVAKESPDPTFPSPGSFTPDPSDTRPCARKQGQLSPGYSYFPNTLSRLNSEGWGVQVYSFGSLCTAVERAEEFASYYRMFKTYIRVKEVDGQRVYTVVYGSLRDEGQARVYCQNFRKIAKDDEGRNAFLVQH